MGLYAFNWINVVKRNENLIIYFKLLKMNHPNISDLALNRTLNELEQRYIELFEDFIYFIFSYTSLIMLKHI